jgi:hypothetical protein
MSGQEPRAPRAKDVVRHARQLGLAELEQRFLECRRSSALSAQANRHRLDHKFSGSAKANADREISCSALRSHFQNHSR